jgi:hypothetical protein
MGVLFISVVGGIIAWMVTRPSTGTTGASTGAAGVTKQVISPQARQGFRQGNAQSPSAKKGEGARAIASPQVSRITQDVSTDLSERAASSYDPEWNMRWLNALHRSRTQEAVNKGERPAPGTPVTLLRVNPYVNEDSGPASSWTRRFFTYQKRFEKPIEQPNAANAVNPARKLDQNDNADQTALVTPLTGPNGMKSVIYPSDWNNLPVRTPQNIGRHGKSSYNYARTPQHMPRPGVPNHQQISRNFQGARKAGNG